MYAESRVVKIDRSGVSFIASAWLMAGALVSFGLAWWAVPFCVLGALFFFFFRDPYREPPNGEHLVLAPADGRVLVAGEVVAPDPPEGAWRQISIFLSPLDVHVNRVPIGGEVTHVSRRSGRYFAAYRKEASAENERTEIGFRCRDGVVICRQIVGVLARRLVCRVRVGQKVGAGERFGIMKFGSRIDLFVPRTATLVVGSGQRVRAGETTVARFTCSE